MITNIIIDIVTGLANMIQMLIGNLFTFLNYVFDIGAFTPTLGFFKENIGEENFDLILKMFQQIGFWGGLVLFSVTFFLMWFQGFREIKDNPLTLVARMAICASLVMLSPSLVTFISDQTDTVFTTIIQPTVGTGTYADHGKLEYDDVGEGILNGMKPVEITAEGSAITALSGLAGVAVANSPAGAAAAAALPAFGGGAGMVVILYLVLRILLCGIVLFNYTKLLVELIRRYLTFCVIYITFPAACGSLASGATSQIFWSYVKSFASESIALIISYFWCAMTLLMYNRMSLTVVNAFLIIAFLNIGVSLEQFMKDHGFTITATGGRLLDSVVASGARIAMMSGQAKGLVGGTIAGVGSIAGSVPAVQIGRGILGQGFGAEGALASMTGSGLVPSIKKTFSGPMGEHTNMPMSPSMRANAMKAFTNGTRDGKEAFASYWNSANATERQGLMQSMKENAFGSALADKLGVDTDAITFNGYDSRTGGLTGSVETPLGTTDFEVTPSAVNDTSIPFEGANGQDSYVTFGDTVSHAPDDGIEASVGANPLDIGMGEDRREFQNYSYNGSMIDAQALSNSALMQSASVNAETLANFASEATSKVSNVDEEYVANPNNWRYKRDASTGIETFTLHKADAGNNGVVSKLEVDGHGNVKSSIHYASNGDKKFSEKAKISPKYKSKKQ